MKTIRDLMAIFGSIAVGWVVFSFNHHTERGMTQGLLFGLFAMVVVIISIRSDQNDREELRRKLDQTHTRNLYLEAAIKQGGDRE
jgi:TctA family transporter